MNATSPAAKTSPMQIAQIIAILISRADEIRFRPLLNNNFRNAEYNIGKPQIATAIYEK